MRAILVDDEMIALEVLSHALRTYEDVDIVGAYTCPKQAIAASEELAPDVVFLDIEMGEQNGILVASEFKSRCKSPEVVFVTAYSDYAIEAFELNAIDYLLKPIQKSRMERTIDRLRTNIEADIYAESEEALRIEGFGAFIVTDSAGNPLKWRTKKSKELFAYLWLHRENPIPKDLLIDEIFYDKALEKAVTLLHTSIYQLRKNLEKLGYKDAVVFSDDSYRLNLTAKSDLDEILSICAVNDLSDSNAQKLVDCYKGALLEKEDYRWIPNMRQKIEDKVLEYCTVFARQKLRAGQNDQCLGDVLNLLYGLDPYNDAVALLMIECLGKAEKTTRLERFYQDYCKTLWDELEIEPSEEVISCYQKFAR